MVYELYVVIGKITTQPRGVEPAIGRRDKGFIVVALVEHVARMAREDVGVKMPDILVAIWFIMLAG